MAVEKVAFTPTVHDLCLPLLAVKSNNRKAFNTWFKHTEPTQTAQANQSLQLIYEENKTKHKTKQSLVASAPAPELLTKISFQNMIWAIYCITSVIDTISLMWICLAKV